MEFMEFLVFYTLGAPLLTFFGSNLNVSLKFLERYLFIPIIWFYYNELVFIDSEQLANVPP